MQALTEPPPTTDTPRRSGYVLYLLLGLGLPGTVLNAAKMAPGTTTRAGKTVEEQGWPRSSYSYD